MIEFLNELFSKKPFMPHEHCFNTAEEVLWVHVIGDILTALAYFAIPIFLVYLVRKRKDMQYKWLVALFAAFILSCGTTHIFAIIGMWHPYYRLEGAVKLFTGVISLTTAIALIPVVPAVLKIPSLNDLKLKNKQLQHLLTELRESKEELKKTNDRLNEAQSVAQMGSWEMEVQTKNVEWSDGFYNILGIEKQDQTPTYEMGMSFIIDEEKAWITKALTEGIKRGDFDITHRIIDVKGNIKHLHTRGKTYFDSSGQPETVIAIAHDITHRVKRENELFEKTQQLERTNEYLQRVSYATSHDLKEPLRGMVSYSQMVLRKDGDNISPQSKEDIEYVISEGKRLSEMVESLLNLSKLENSDPELIQTDLNSILAESLIHLNYAIEEKNASIKKEKLPTVLTDPKLMNVVFRNLLSNALKFNNGQPEIVVSAERNHGTWQFVVADNGIGFQEQYKDQIFDIFHKLHPKTRYAGSGMGLAICKSIIESLGGNIWARSRPGEGTTIFFTLPA